MSAFFSATLRSFSAASEGRLASVSHACAVPEAHVQDTGNAACDTPHAPPNREHLLDAGHQELSPGFGARVRHLRRPVAVEYVLAILAAWKSVVVLFVRHVMYRWCRA